MNSQTPDTSREPRWPFLLVGICGALCAVLGVLVLAGWHTGNADMVRIWSVRVRMQYLTAVCFLLSGTGLGCLAFRSGRVLTGVCGAVVAAAGALVSLEYLLQLKLGSALLVSYLPVIPGVPSGRPAAPAAAAFTLCGINLLLLGFPIPMSVRRASIWILSSPVLALSLVALSGDMLGFTGLFVSGAFIGMSPHTVAGLCVLSAGLLSVRFRDPLRLIEDRWLPVPLCLGTLAGALTLWQALTLDRMRAINRQAGLIAENLAADSQIRLLCSLRTLELLKLRWENPGGTPRTEWEAQAKAFAQDEPVLEAVGRTDSSWRVEWLEPGHAKAMAPGADHHGECRRDTAEALREAQERRRMVISPGIGPHETAGGFVVYLPLFSDGRFDGFLFGVFRPGQLAETAMKNPAMAHHRISLVEDREGAPGQPVRGKGGKNSIAAVSKVDFHGRRWCFAVEPDPGAMPGRQLPGTVLMLGTLLGLALAAAVPGLQRYRVRSGKIRTANQQLKKARRELRETLREKKAARTLLETAGRMARLGHWELPLGTGDPQWSAVMYEIHDLPPNAPVTREGVRRFVHPEDRERVGQRAREAFETGEIYDMEVRLITEKGRHIWVRMRGEPRHGENGEIVAIHGIVQDIDERHRAAELLREQNRQLATATARAEAHARAKAEFLANMSHEIRTPLNAVIGMSELLMHGRLEVRERGFVETIHASGDMLLSLINDILDFSKIESGQLELERIPVPVRDLAESVMDLLAGAAAAKKLELICWTDPAVPQAVLGDPTRLRQVLMNLVGNAIKFTACGEVFLKVSVRERGGASWLHAAVRDSGIGISAEGCGRLFTVFSQVDASTTRRFGGTGLGLAISRRIIRAMGGDIQVESEVGKGSVFQFEIPLRPVEPPVSPDAPGNGRQAAPALRDMRVLIVDANETSRWVLRTRCASWSMRPTVAGGACQALALIAAGEKYHLAIISGLMPDMDRQELVTRIRQERNAQELPVLILTSMDDPGRGWGTLTVSDVLTKPVRSAALLGAISGILLRTPRPEPGEPAVAAADETPAVSRPLRILVAEDNPVNQRVVGLHLQRMGHLHTVAGNGAEALAAVAAAGARFDVILLDIQMPVMDGLEAARELCRLYPAAQRPWIIALTANAQRSDQDGCLAAGMDDYLSKPVRAESLHRALQRASGGRSDKTE